MSTVESGQSPLRGLMKTLRKIGAMLTAIGAIFTGRKSPGKEKGADASGE